MRKYELIQTWGFRNIYLTLTWGIQKHRMMSLKKIPNMKRVVLECKINFMENNSHVVTRFLSFFLSSFREQSNGVSVSSIAIVFTRRFLYHEVGL